MVWAAIIGAVATVAASAMKGGGAGTVQAAPSNLTNGGQGGFSSDNWTVVTGKNNKADATNSQPLDWKLVAVLGIGSMLLWKTSRNRR